MTAKNLTSEAKAAQAAALERLTAAIGAGAVQVVIGRNGGIALKGWAEVDRAGVSDLCAYRALMHAPEMRRAVMRAEALAGTRVSAIAIATGVHSHDGGQTWSRH
jgi:thiamine monophosphate synthase